MSDRAGCYAGLIVCILSVLAVAGIMYAFVANL